MKKNVIIAITKHGAALGRKLKAGLSESDLFISEKFREDGDSAQYFSVPIKELTAKIFNEYEGLIYIVSLGAVVRTLAPYLKDKHTDPAVIVVDDKANFAISVLSGHVGGANALTTDVARILGAKPVITTASDVGKTIPVDILGREFGWKTERNENITKVSASVVNEEPVGIYQDAGETNWWKRESPLPKNFQRFESLAALVNAKLSSALIITDRILEDINGLLSKSVVYRPKSLILGMGCDRGVSLEEVESLVVETVRRHRLEIQCVKCIATIDLKMAEPALNQLSQKYGWPIITYARDELNSVGPLPNPSKTVEKYVGTPGVSEPSAMLAANTRELVVEKTKSKMATLAVARIRY